MGVIQYLVRHDNRTLFELGKSGWSLTHDGDGGADCVESIPRSIGEWVRRIDRDFNMDYRYRQAEGLEVSDDEFWDVEHCRAIASRLYRFCDGGTAFQSFGDAGDEIDALAYGKQYQLVGSVYLVENEPAMLEGWNDRHRLDASGKDRDGFSWGSEWGAAKALGAFEKSIPWETE